MVPKPNRMQDIRKIDEFQPPRRVKITREIHVVSVEHQIVMIYTPKGTLILYRGKCAVAETGRPTGGEGGRGLQRRRRRRRRLVSCEPRTMRGI